MIWSHENGQQVPAGVPILLHGIVNDPDDLEQDLIVAWYAGGDTACPISTPSDDGYTECEFVPILRTTDVVLIVQDPGWEIFETQIVLDVLQAHTPEGEILSPQDGQVFAFDDPVALLGRVSDQDEPAEDLTVRWHSDADGNLSLAVHPDSEGLTAADVVLSPGAHVVSLSVTDQTGRSDVVEVSVTVQDVNEPPTCQITVPLTGAILSGGEAVELIAEVEDAEDEPSLLTVSWFSDVDGVLGSTNANASGVSEWSVASLSLGSHELTMEVVDTDGERCVDTVSVTIVSGDTGLDTATPCGLMGDVPLADASVWMVGEQPGDRFGAEIASADVDGDGSLDLVIGADGAGTGGVVYVFTGDPSGWTEPSAASVMLTGQAGSMAGAGLAVGDLDGDGTVDVAVGAPDADAGNGDEGAAYIASGPLNGVVDLFQTTTWLGEVTGAHAGDVHSVAGDQYGDLVPDLLVGAVGQGDGGAVYVVSGALGGSWSLLSAHARLDGRHAGDLTGTDVAGGGDLNADGIPDLAIGVPGHDRGTPDWGAVMVVYGPVATGVATLDTSLGVMLEGVATGDAVGHAVAFAGDVDDDDQMDLVIGAPGVDDAGIDRGAAYLVLGPTGGPPSLSLADARFIGEQDGDAAGSAVAGAGDIDGDGYDDLLIAAPLADGGYADAGVVYIVYGPVAGDVALGDADARLMGGNDNERVGLAVVGVGDLNADGHGDVAVSALGADEAGAVYVFFGCSP